MIPDGHLGFNYFYFYPLTYLWRATPVTLIGLLLAIWGFLTRRRPFDRPKTRLAVVGLALLVVVFTLGMTLGAKKFDRYILPIYPALDLIAGLGWYGLATLIQDKYPSAALRFAAAFIVTAVVGIQMASALNTFPYYLSYYNPLMGGSRRAPYVMQIGWGEGLDQAARYLNQKPDAKDIRVVSWYATGPFSFYFKGRDRSILFAPEASADNWERLFGSDYAVVYIAQWQRQIPIEVLDYVSKLTPEHTIWINGLEYVRIYKLP